MILWLATGCMWGLIACVFWNASAALPCYRWVLVFAKCLLYPKGTILHWVHCQGDCTVLFCSSCYWAFERKNIFALRLALQSRGVFGVYPQEIPNCPAILRFWVTLPCERVESLTPCPDRAQPDTFRSKTCIFILLQLVDPAVPSDIILGQSPVLGGVTHYK